MDHFAMPTPHEQLVGTGGPPGPYWESLASQKSQKQRYCS